MHEFTVRDFATDHSLECRLLFSFHAIVNTDFFVNLKKKKKKENWYSETFVTCFVPLCPMERDSQTSKEVDGRVAKVEDL